MTKQESQESKDARETMFADFLQSGAPSGEAAEFAQWWNDDEKACAEVEGLRERLAQMEQMMPATVDEANKKADYMEEIQAQIEAMRGGRGADIIKMRREAGAEAQQPRAVTVEEVKTDGGQRVPHRGVTYNEFNVSMQAINIAIFQANQYNTNHSNYAPQQNDGQCDEPVSAPVEVDGADINGKRREAQAVPVVAAGIKPVPAKQPEAAHGRVRSDALTPVINKAVSACDGRTDTAEVFNKLREWASEKPPRHQPFMGVTSDGIKWLDSNDNPKELSRDALAKRLKPRR